MICKIGCGLRPVASATGRVGYATRVQSWTRVAYPTRPVALATGQKPCPVKFNTVLCKIKW